MAASNNIAKCFICGEKFSNWVGISGHLAVEHEKSDKLKCVKLLDRDDLECSQTFNSIAALRQHFLKDCCIVKSVKDNPFSQSDENMFPVLDYLQNAIETYVTKIEGMGLHHEVTDEIIKGLYNIVSASIETILEQVKKKQNGDMCGCSQMISSIKDICCCLIGEHTTRYNRDSTLNHTKGFVPTNTVTVDNSTYELVLITDTLQSLFDENNFAEMYNEHNLNSPKCSPGVINDFCCGLNYRNIDLFKEHPEAIQIQLYIDEFELCAPLKSKSKKICGIYFNVRNIPAKFRSRNDNMYLVALIHHDEIKKTGFNKLLRPIINDLKQLEDVGIKTKNRFMKGAVVNICFDNAGGNELFCLPKSFNSNFFCRICKVTKQESQIYVTENPKLLRTVDEYEHQTATKSFGYTDKCIFNELKSFNTVKCRSQDLMHDVLEGAVKFTLIELFRYLDSNNIMTYALICELVNNYEYGSLESKVKPSQLHPAQLKSKNIRQSASQVYCLFINLPFIFKTVLEPILATDKQTADAWSCIEYLLQITQIIYSAEIEETYLVQLIKITKQYLETYKKVFATTIKPKMHFLTHYPETIRTVGPLRDIWMMRAEAKHKTFTSFAKSTNNFRNITKSLAQKHQQLLYINHKFIESYVDKVSVSTKSREIDKMIDSNYFSPEVAEFIVTKIGNAKDWRLTEFVIKRPLYC